MKNTPIEYVPLQNVNFPQHFPAVVLPQALPPVALGEQGTKHPVPGYDRLAYTPTPNRILTQKKRRIFG